MKLNSYQLISNLINEAGKISSPAELAKLGLKHKAKVRDLIKKARKFASV